MLKYIGKLYGDVCKLPWYLKKRLFNEWTLVLFFVQSLSHVQLFATPWTAACQASLSLTILWSLLNLMSSESMRPSNHFILSPPCPAALNLSHHVFFSNESVLHVKWPKYWRFSFSISPSSEYSVNINFL